MTASIIVFLCLLKYSNSFKWWYWVNDVEYKWIQKSSVSLPHQKRKSLSEARKGCRSY